MSKSGGKCIQVVTVGKVGKSNVKWGILGKSGEKWRKVEESVGNSGNKW